MAKLTFRYGVMGSSKSLNLLAVAHNYDELNRNILCLKPALDTRQGNIKSRAGLEREAISIKPKDNLLNLIEQNDKINCILVDEVQFFTSQQIDELGNIVDNYNIPVIAYGLKNDYMGNLFEASKRLLEIADEIEEIKTLCKYCNHKATHNLLFLDGKVVDNYLESGNIVCGDSEFVSVCRKHYNNILNKKEKE